ncbi:MAG: hypothetical protein Q7S52_02650 [bacterium]|nr:hypothetical protein [bacterium]
MKNQKTLIMLGVTLIFAGAIGFYGGMTYQKGKISSAQADRRAQFTQGGGQFVGGGGAGGPSRTLRTQGATGGGFTVGEVLAKDVNSLTLKLRDGGSKIVFFTPTTPITKTAPGTPEEIVVGGSVMVSGTANTDGSIAAESIQMR